MVGLRFPSSLYRVLWGEEVEGRERRKRKERWNEVKEAQCPRGGGAKMRSYQLLLQIPTPELLSKPGSSARSMTGLPNNKDEYRPATWCQSETFSLAELGIIFLFEVIP